MAEGTEGGEAVTFTQAQVDELVAGLKGKTSELLGEVKRLKEGAKVFDGLDPEKARAALAANAEAEARRHKDTGDWDAREKALRDTFAAEHTKVVDPMTAELAQLRTDLFDALAGREAVEAITGAKGNPVLLLPVIKPELDVAVIDGKRVTVVKGPDGKPRYHATNSALVTVADRVKELKARPEYLGAFEGTGASGSGATGGGSGGAAGDSDIRKLPGSRMVEAAFAGGKTK